MIVPKPILKQMEAHLQNRMARIRLKTVNQEPQTDVWNRKKPARISQENTPEIAK